MRISRRDFLKAATITGSFACDLLDHYVEALDIKRKCDQMAAIFAGKMPCASSFVPGGITEAPDEQKISDFGALLRSVQLFIDSTFVPDVQDLTGLSEFADYFSIGAGCGNLISLGGFDLDDTSEPARLFARGRLTGSALGDVDASGLFERIDYSWYDGSAVASLLSSRVSQYPSYDSNPSGYSWVKSPRYENGVYETGPLARMKINGDYSGGVSVFDRLLSRAFESSKIADAMVGWLDELTIGGEVYEKPIFPEDNIDDASRVGLIESPGGALAHKIRVSLYSSIFYTYNVITATTWNASPKDNLGQYGPIEQALVGTVVNDMANPIELMRVVHSFDPCSACAVH